MSENIRLYFDGMKKSHTSFTFPGGEIQVKGAVKEAGGLMGFDKWCPTYQPDTVDIVALIKDANTMMEVFLLTDAVRRFFQSDYGNRKPYITLDMSYLPYGRQDRVCAESEALSLRVFADLVNAMKYDRVRIYDPHSDVSAVVFDNVDVVETYEMIKASRFLYENAVLVAPDTGAKKKTYSLAKKLSLPIILGDKNRDVTTGNITGTTVNFMDQTFSDSQRFLIVDDICDGGRTFIELAKEIRKTYPNSQIDLYVTNGIFSKGFEVFNGVIDYIYCTYTFVDPKSFPANVEAII